MTRHANISCPQPTIKAALGGGLRQDTRAIQLYLGHRNIQHTVLYTQLATDRFNDFWKD